jgi:hypothetical protein
LIKTISQITNNLETGQRHERIAIDYREQKFLAQFTQTLVDVAGV